MQRFHLHLRQGEALACPDDEGAAFDNLEAAYLEAFHSAQELWPILLEDRRDPRRYVLRSPIPLVQFSLSYLFPSSWRPVMTPAVAGLCLRKRLF